VFFGFLEGNMRWIAPALLLLPLVARAEAGSSDPLWDRAVTLFLENMDRIPATMVERERVFDRKGHLDRTTVSRYSVGRRDGDVVVDLLESVRDDKPFTSGKKKEIEARKRKQRKDEQWRKEDSIFHPSQRERVTFRRTAERLDIGGRPCVGFEFAQQRPEAVWRGTVWLDEDDGTPWLITSTPDTPPPVPDLKVKALTIAFRYTRPDAERWYLASMEIRVKFETTILLYTYRGEVVTELEFGGF
jgi:hypothetical protein